ncbi:MAG TPA: DUF488 domain-containing protein [Hyphomicrobiales bacterium]|nr:DUF488 domain-containing protein [Hyphomicrobiales bacterium]
MTIGYEATPAEAVLGRLEGAGVRLLVDVRAIAASRRPGFSKRQLAAGLSEHGIDYLHLRALGTPKEGRLAARRGDMTMLERIYMAHFATPEAQAEFAELKRLVASGRPICLLCYERDHRQCHRRFIAEAIEDGLGVAAEHLAA